MVVNSGKTAVHFVQYVYNLDATVGVVIIAGVAQAQCVFWGQYHPGMILARHAKLSLVALRLSDNKSTGRRITGTGNRLFNTTHLP